MRQTSAPAKEPAEQVVSDIRRATRRQFSAEEKIRIVLQGLRGEDSIAELCRREGISQNPYYRWSKEFLEAGKKRLAGDTAREGGAATACGASAPAPSWVAARASARTRTTAGPRSSWRLARSVWRATRPGRPVP